MHENRNKVKVYCIVVIGLILLSGIAPLSNFLDLAVQPLEKEETELEPIIGKEICPKASATYWNLTNINIFIDNNDPANDWDTVNDTNEWCNGKGTLDEPYVIENVTIQGNGTDHCIEILNSKDVYFTIRNCTLENERDDNKKACMYFFNVNNSTLYNNSVSGGFYGIFIIDGVNDTINDNKLNNCTSGLYMKEGGNNTIMFNTINQCFGSGAFKSVYVRDSNNNTFFNNTIITQSVFDYASLEFNKASNITCFNNTLFNSHLIINNCFNSTFLQNYINGCGITLTGGIGFEVYRTNNISTSNEVNGKPVYYYTDKKGLDSSNFSNAGQILLFNCSDSIVEKQEISNTSRAVFMLLGKNNTIARNNFSYCLSGIYVYWASNNTIFNNTMKGYEDQVDDIGIHMYGYCENNTIANNTLWDYKIQVEYNSKYQEFENNSLWRDGITLDLISLDNEIDQSNLVNNGTLYYYRNEQDLIPEDFSNAGQIILAYCDNVLIQNCNISWVRNEFYCCSGITIESCNFSNNILAAIINYDSANFTIRNCNFNFSGVAMFLSGNSTIIGNTITNGGGISQSSGIVNISDNTIINCTSGIFASSIKDSVISNNEIYGCREYGMRVGGENNRVFKNNISKNNDGFRTYSTNDIIYFHENIIKDNEQYGLYISHSNYLIYNNTISNNGINALDEVAGNDWNNSLIGNYWSNYSGTDVDDDGIAESQHPIQGTAGAIDYKPIFWDAPNITIISPTNHSTFGPNSPNYEVKVEEGRGYLYYYEFNVTGARSTPNSSLDHSLEEVFEGKFDQTMWSDLPAGDVLITFYVNDSRGYCGKREVNVTVILDSTTIVINSPKNGKILGNSSPSFEVTAFLKSDETLGDIWYTIDGGNENFTLETPKEESNSGTIDQDAWNDRPAGKVMLTFYINDSTHVVFSDSIALYKDSLVPQIAINSPSDDDTFGATAPDFEVVIVEANLNHSWYTIGEDPFKNFFNTNSTLNQTAWTALADGTHSIRFYANDTFSNQANKTVKIIKDTYVVITLPTVEIVSPIIDQLSGAGAASFVVNVTKGTYAVSKVFYVINGSTQLNYLTIQGKDEEQFSGTLNATEWAKLFNGTLTLTFYAKDNQGYSNSASVVIRRDIVNPTLSVLSPSSNAEFGTDAPTYKISCSDDSGIGSTWYAINEDATRHVIGSNLSGRIDSEAWKSLSDGTVNITFYASDKAGNVKSIKVSITKSTSDGSGLGGLDIMEFLSSPMGIGTMVGGIGIIAVLGLLVVKKKRSKGKDMTEKKPSKKDKLAERETDSSIKEISSVQESNIADEEPKGAAKPIEESTPIQQEEIDETPIRKTRPEYQYEPIEEEVELVDQAAAPEDEELEQWGKELEDKELEIEEEVIPEVDDAKAKLQEIEIKIIKINSAIAQVDANFSEGKISQELYINQKTRLFEELGKLEGEKSVLEEKVK